MNLYLKNFKLKFASCFMVVFLLFNLIVPVVKPKKVDAAGFALGYLIAAAVYGNAIVAGSNIVLASTDVEGLSEAFWAKAAEDGKVSEYQTQLLNYGNQLVYDSVKDAYIPGSPHVSGRLLQTLSDVIADYYYINPDNTTSDLNLYLTCGNFKVYALNASYVVLGGKTEHCKNNYPILQYYQDSKFLVPNATKWGYNAGYNFYLFDINTSKQIHHQLDRGSSTKINNYYYYSCNNVTMRDMLIASNGYYDYTVNHTIKALSTYALPAQIPAATVTAIENGSDTIPTDGFASITYEGDQWIYESDNYYIIDRDAEPEPIPTPTPTPEPTPTPDPDQPADDATVNEWLKAIYLKLVSLDANIAQMLPTVITDLVAINDTLKDISTAGGLNATDPEAQQSAFTNIFTGMLEFLKTALVPTQSLNLDALNTMPDNLNEKIPFCLAGDVVRIFTVFQAEPTAPKIDIPFDMSSVGGPVHHLDIDFSIFDEHAPLFRNLAFIAFLIGLVWMTIKMTLGGGGES